jgi:hypothetical protein
MFKGLFKKSKKEIQDDIRGIVKRGVAGARAAELIPPKVEKDPNSYAMTASGPVGTKQAFGQSLSGDALKQAIMGSTLPSELKSRVMGPQIPTGGPARFPISPEMSRLRDEIASRKIERPMYVINSLDKKENDPLKGNLLDTYSSATATKPIPAATFSGTR